MSTIVGIICDHDQDVFLIGDRVHTAIAKAVADCLGYEPEAIATRNHHHARGIMYLYNEPGTETERSVCAEFNLPCFYAGVPDGPKLVLSMADYGSARAVFDAIGASLSDLLYTPFYVSYDGEHFKIKTVGK